MVAAADVGVQEGVERGVVVAAALTRIVEMTVVQGDVEEAGGGKLPKGDTRLQMIHTQEIHMPGILTQGIRMHGILMLEILTPEIRMPEIRMLGIPT